MLEVGPPEVVSSSCWARLTGAEGRVEGTGGHSNLADCKQSAATASDDRWPPERQLSQTVIDSYRWRRSRTRPHNGRSRPHRRAKWTKWAGSRLTSASPILILLLAALLPLIELGLDWQAGWARRSGPIRAAAAYQLTNNLIANNSPPRFASLAPALGSNSEIVVRVKEGPQSIGRLIFTLRGEDPDEDPLTFGVLGSLASDLLRVENVPGNQANVYLRKELDRETAESHQVVITLTDGKLGRGNWVSRERERERSTGVVDGARGAEGLGN